LEVIGLEFEGSISKKRFRKETLHLRAPARRGQKLERERKNHHKKSARKFFEGEELDGADGRFRRSVSKKKPATKNFEKDKEFWRDRGTSPGKDSFDLKRAPKMGRTAWGTINMRREKGR